MAGDIMYDMESDLTLLKRDLWEKNLLLHRVTLAKSQGGSIIYGIQVQTYLDSTFKKEVIDAVRDQLEMNFRELKGTFKRYISTDMRNTDNKIIETDHNLHNSANDVKLKIDDRH